MADALRNEFAVTLDGTEYTLRATFTAIRGIERDLKLNLLPLITKVSNGDVGVEQAAIVIFHGMRGFDDTRLKLEEIGDLIMKTGLSKVMVPVVDFLLHAMEGASLGKPQEAPAAEKAPAA